MQEGDEHISESILIMSKNVNDRTSIYYAWYIHNDRCQFYECQAAIDIEEWQRYVF